MIMDGKGLSSANMRANGISPSQIYRLMEANKLVKVERGQYKLADTRDFEAFKNAGSTVRKSFNKETLSGIYELIISGRCEKALQIFENECEACGLSEYATVVGKIFNVFIKILPIDSAAKKFMTMVTMAANGHFSLNSYELIKYFYYALIRNNVGSAEDIIEILEMGEKFGEPVDVVLLKRLVGQVGVEIELKEANSLSAIYSALTSENRDKKEVFASIRNYCITIGKGDYVELLEIIYDEIPSFNGRNTSEFLAILTMISMDKYEFKISKFLNLFYETLNDGNYRIVEMALRILELSKIYCGEKVDTEQLRKLLEIRKTVKWVGDAEGIAEKHIGISSESNPLSTIYEAVLGGRYETARRLVVDYFRENDLLDFVKWAEKTFQVPYLEEPINVTRAFTTLNLIILGLFEYYPISPHISNFYSSIVKSDFSAAQNSLEQMRLGNSLNGQLIVEPSSFEIVLLRMKTEYMENLLASQPRSEKPITEVEAVRPQSESISSNPSAPQVSTKVEPTSEKPLNAKQKKLYSLKEWLDKKNTFKVKLGYSEQKSAVTIEMSKNVPGLHHRYISTTYGPVVIFYTDGLSPERSEILDHPFYLRLIEISRYLRDNSTDVWVLESISSEQADIIKRERASLHIYYRIIDNGSTCSIILCKQQQNNEFMDKGYKKKMRFALRVFESGDYEEALKLYGEVLGGAYVPTVVYFQMGNIYRILGDYEKATKFFDACKLILSKSKHVPLSSNQKSILSDFYTGKQFRGVLPIITERDFETSSSNATTENTDLESKLFLISDISNPQKMEDMIKGFNLSSADEIMLRLMYVRQAYQNGEESRITEKFLKIATKYKPKSDEIRALLKEIDSSKKLWLNQAKFQKSLRPVSQ